MYQGGESSSSPPPARQLGREEGEAERQGTGGRIGRLLQGLSNLWRGGRLTDVRIESQDGHNFMAHRAILAAASDYFMAMFTGDMEERHRDHIVLKGVTAAGLEPLLKFVYTGNLTLSEGNVLEVIAAAAHLEFGFALPPCVRFMVQVIDVDNCVDIYNTAKTYQLKAYNAGDDIETLSFEFICNHFHQVIDGGHHLRLAGEDLLLCLTGKTGEGSDVVRYGPEVDLFHAVMEWRSSHKDGRPLNAIRYPLMTYAELDEVSSILEKEDLSCNHLVDDARHYHSLAMHRQVHRAESVRLQTRNRPCVVTLARSNQNGASRGNLRFFVLSSPEGCPPPAHSLKALTWLQVPQLDRSIHENIRHGFTALSWESVNGFLVICGSTELGHLRCYMLDTRTFLWSPMAMMNVPRTNCPLVECDGDLFSLGGIIKNGSVMGEHVDGGYSDVIERYSFESGRWEIVGHMGEALVNHGACSLDGKIYMYGGRRQNGTMSGSLYTYEPSTDIWCEHQYRFPINENPVLCVLLERIYAADPSIREMSYYSCTDHRDTWWGVLMRERHLVPVNSLHAVFLSDSVFFLNGNLEPESNINMQLNGSNNKCTQVTVHKNRSISGHPIRQPDYPEGWTPCVAAALSLPWNIIREAKPA